MGRASLPALWFDKACPESIEGLTANGTGARSLWWN